jgi:hypothetical protein
MSRRSRFRPLLLAGAALALAAGCGEDPSSGPSGPAAGTQAPDFAVLDVNPNSPRHGEAVSPRDYEGLVSAWYFGHAT